MLLARWRLIAAVTVAATALAIGVALLLPREYAAEAKVLRAEGGGIASVLGVDRLPGGLGQALLGGGGSDYTRYLAILHSRSLREKVIDEFDLISVYDVSGKRFPLEAALSRLDKNLDFRVSLEFRHLSIIAYDREPERAAAIANFVVQELNNRNARLTSEDARQSRVFIETRLGEARAALDSVRSALQAFQENHGLIELEAQAEAFLTGMAQQSGRIAELEVQYQSLLAQYGADNPRVATARSALQAARRQMAGALGGTDALMPVALREMPALARQYTDLLQEQMVQVQIIETIYPIYERAQFQERSEMQAVQVLDVAAVPTLPARPARRIIVLAALLSGLMLGCLYVIGSDWLRWRGPAIRKHLRRRPLRAPAIT